MKETYFICDASILNVLGIDGEVNSEIKLAGDETLGTIGSWTIPVETDEEKIERLRLDILKKKYPIFSHIEDIIEKVKSGVKIYSNDIMREVCLCAASLVL